ncbi:hypothetical protein BJ322DRAFT_1021830 [Thelephora terrestris]|uniref:Uncharacterized protein n=1 Tax=Thelephora terrestris TaxID=56493 RepID=A0A9P6H2G4_9AGAM|nr:hypothetical protein BJ322DRAFT_1114804 [Thelephora terrestris]KAF9784123.1 hypothetical protein BJ322DRAFT_1021830 [Thelephora terrestris]
MRHHSLGEDPVLLSKSTAFAMCYGSIRMSHCLVIELPEPELREIRYMLDSLLVKADLALDLMEREISLDFGGLNVDIDPDSCTPPGAEDFGAVLVSTTVTADADQSGSISLSCRRGSVTFDSGPAMAASTPPPPPTSPVSVRIPTPAQEPTIAPPPTITHGCYPLIVSSRENVGFPDYSYHPHFVRAGVPGTYRFPPTSSGHAPGSPHYAIIKGLYVGVFDDEDEIKPWVLGIPGSSYHKARSWEEARDLYNARLNSGAVQVLA